MERGRHLIQPPLWKLSLGRAVTCHPRPEVLEGMGGPSLPIPKEA